MKPDDFNNHGGVKIKLLPLEASGSDYCREAVDTQSYGTPAGEPKRQDIFAELENARTQVINKDLLTMKPNVSIMVR
jgi:hypothetical protein